MCLLWIIISLFKYAWDKNNLMDRTVEIFRKGIFYFASYILAVRLEYSFPCLEQKPQDLFFNNFLFKWIEKLFPASLEMKRNALSFPKSFVLRLKLPLSFKKYKSALEKTLYLILRGIKDNVGLHTKHWLKNVNPSKTVVPCITSTDSKHHIYFHFLSPKQDNAHEMERQKCV